MDCFASSTAPLEDVKSVEVGAKMDELASFFVP